MTHPSDLEARVAALEARMDEVAADAASARHLAAARDRDLADLGVKVDSNRSVVNALGERTAARFTRLEQQIDGVRAELQQQIDGVRTEMHTGFGEMRGKLDQTAAGQQQIAGFLSTLIDQQVGG